ncbi:MAG TPA: sulfotransferase [Allosphingosinicella sp.]|uniref:sulfotransferase family protein n=1 Tax=Allosphingosinicella sp. TaxID=2823234 RepID=UPI002ED9FA06
MSRINQLLTKAWRKGLLPEPVLERAVLEKAAGYTLREHRLQEALERLLWSLREEAALNPIGKAMAHGQIVRLLRERARAERLWAQHPEILEWPMSAPIVVLGQMRSGTTRLQRLLACDRRLAHTRLFETMSPVPRHGRRLETYAGLKIMAALNPELARIHPAAPNHPEEEFGLFSLSLFGAQIEAQWRVPSFARWWEGEDRRPVYRDFRRLMQTIAWSRRDKRPRVMKAPQFMEDLDLLLEAFPDARLIRLRRDAAAVVASSASLVWNQMRVQSDDADKAWIGAEWLRKTQRREEAAAKVLSARPELPQIKVEFDAVSRDWQGEMRRIYAFLDMELTEEVEGRMRRYLERAERSGFRGHSYNPQEFGLSGAF